MAKKRRPRLRDTRGPRAEPLYYEQMCVKCGAVERRLNPRALRQKRLKLGMTLKQAGTWLGYTEHHIWDMEMGNRKASDRYLALLGMAQSSTHH